MKSCPRFFLFVILVFLLITVFQGNNGQATCSMLIKKETNESLSREWDEISLIYPDQYHMPEQVVEELNLIAKTAPDIVDMTVLGESVQGREIHLMKITNEQITVPKSGVFIVAHHHAREQITVEAALRFMHHLINNYGSNSIITGYIDTMEIYIIPTINPDGLHYVVGNETLTGDPWLRKNLKPFDDDNDSFVDEDPYEDINEDGIVSGFDVFLKHSGSEDEFLYSYYEGNDTDQDGEINEDIIGGVDLNRNYGYRWNDSSLNTGSTSDSTAETFPGLEPFSEPETQIIRDFTADHSFSMAMSLHSGINTTYFPWASGTTWSEPDRYYKIYNDLINILPDYFFQDYLNADITPTKILSSYTSAGEWGDWMYVARNCQAPMTFEIYHEEGSGEYLAEPVNETETHITWQFDSIKSYFAPQDEKINALWDDILPAFDYWLATTPQLEISDVEIIGENSVGSSLSIKAKIKNTSPRVTTIEGLMVILEDFTPLISDGSPVTFSELTENAETEISFEYELETQVNQSNKITLLLGNEFVGYKAIVIQEENMNKSQSISFDILGILIAAPILYIATKRTHKK